MAACSKFFKDQLCKVNVQVKNIGNAEYIDPMIIDK